MTLGQLCDQWLDSMWTGNLMEIKVEEIKIENVGFKQATANVEFGFYKVKRD